jgi:hypothetical protein
MKDKSLQAIEKIDKLLEAYQERLCSQPNNQALKQAFDDLIFIKDVLWEEGKEEVKHFYSKKS